MGLIQTIKNIFDRDNGQTFRYQCNVCQATFESEERDITLVGCEACGADNIRTFDRGAN